MSYDDRILSDVNVLMAVVRAGTIVRASEALALSPSGVSRALARLEARIGVRLLDRTTRSMSLTDEGRRFYERVGPHLDGIEEAAIEASGSATPRTGSRFGHPRRKRHNARIVAEQSLEADDDETVAIRDDACTVRHA